ncbi:MAG: hypothetical protein ACI4I2_05470 [Oscillospiraceae bacterium]
MKKTLKRVLPVLISSVMAMSVVTVSANAQQYTPFETYTAEQCTDMAFVPMTDKEIQEMYLGASKNAVSRSGLSLPYSGGISFSSGSSADAYSPIFDVNGKLSSSSQIRLAFSVNSGKHRLYVEVDYYSKSEGRWLRSMYGKDTIISPVSIINTMTATEDISQFCVKFTNDPTLYATDFNYTLSII